MLSFSKVASDSPKLVLVRPESCCMHVSRPCLGPVGMIRDAETTYSCLEARANREEAGLAQLRATAAEVVERAESCKLL